LIAQPQFSDFLPLPFAIPLLQGASLPILIPCSFDHSHILTCAGPFAIKE
jgi:hypothetical protein